MHLVWTRFTHFFIYLEQKLVMSSESNYYLHKWNYTPKKYVVHWINKSKKNWGILQKKLLEQLKSVSIYLRNKQIAL